MQIRGREVDFKIGRLKDAEALEKALDNMGVNEKKINRKGKLSEILAEEIRLFRTFIVEATGEDILDGCEDFEEAKGAYMDMIQGVAEQKKELLGFSLENIK